MKISPEVLDVLKRSTITETSVMLPEMLDRKIYVATTDKVLKEAGGKWNRKLKVHLFEKDPREKLGTNIETGVFHSIAVAKYLVELADVEGKNVLEPSAGEGALVKACLEAGAAKCFAIELNTEYIPTLKTILNLPVLNYDFLKTHTTDFDIFDRVVMNPPFAKNQAILHLKHALNFLSADGILVSIFPDIRGQKKLDTLLEYLDEKHYGVEMIELPRGSFKESGTMVNTIILKVTKL